MSWSRSSRLKANELRKQRGVTVARVCRKLKVSPSTYYRRLASGKGFERIWCVIMEAKSAQHPAPLTASQSAALRRHVLEAR